MSAARATPQPAFSLTDPDTRVYVGDCRQILSRLPEVQRQQVDLVFADPPFNWNRDYDRHRAAPSPPASPVAPVAPVAPANSRRARDVHARARAGARAQAPAPTGVGDYDTWHDGLPREDYLAFTHAWIAACVGGLRAGGALWINIPDDTAAEIVVYCKNELGLAMVNWCIWHYRFGQNRRGAFIASKVHALYFVKPAPDGSLRDRTWDPSRILEPSDRASIYADPRTQRKRDGMPPGLRVPMDVWYGAYWGRVQGNNKERRARHDNQLPEAYLERVILSTSRPGDLVLDPFLGSGTTAVMARHYGRRFIGTEFSKANAASAFARIEQGPHNPGKALGVATPIFAARTSRAAKA